MSVFTFADKNILESRLLPHHGSRYFIIHTSYGILHRKETTVTPGSTTGTVFARDSILCGTISWKHETFDIGGVVSRVRDLRHRAGLFSR